MMKRRRKKIIMERKSQPVNKPEDENGKNPEKNRENREDENYDEGENKKDKRDNEDDDEIDRFVLKNLNLVIPKGKITAIVGVSGSGKTTLIKLLLKFFKPQRGSIRLGDIDFEEIHSGEWRKRVGVVMQNGYIFSDTIVRNISLGDMKPDIGRVKKAMKIACIYDFVMKELPLRYLTKIGEEGLSLSEGQKQRILLARAIYKEPEYLFLDEATSSLDAENEREIMENLEEFFKGRTVVVVAHRLSTVKNADNIVVLERGRIVEEGNHKELIGKRGRYYELVKNQLELGK